MLSIAAGQVYAGMCTLHNLQLFQNRFDILDLKLGFCLFHNEHP